MSPSGRATQKLAENINRDRKNPRYLSDIEIPATVRATSDLAEAVKDRELVICAVPSHGVRDVIAAAASDLPHNCILVSTVKGIERETGMLMDEVFRDVLDPVHHPSLTFLVGPFVRPRDRRWSPDCGDGGVPGGGVCDLGPAVALGPLSSLLHRPPTSWESRSGARSRT